MKQKIIKEIFKLSKTDIKVLEHIKLYSCKHTVKQIANELRFNRTTIQKSIMKLKNNFLINQFQENLSPCGYRFLYKCVDNINQIALNQLKKDYENNKKILME